MPVYRVAPNPYRASTGSVPVPIIKTGNSRDAATGQYVERCRSCGADYCDEHTIPLNTPYSTPPTLGSSSRAPARRPVVVSSNVPTLTSLPPPGQVLHRYRNGALVYEPATSMPPRKDRRERRNSVSSSQPRTYHHHHESRSERHQGYGSGEQWHNYQHEIDIRDEQRGVRGRTTIPRRLVNKEAIQESGLPWEEDEGARAITVFRTLSRRDIEKLVERTEAIRARRRGGGKVVRIVPEPAVVHHSDSHARRSEGRVARAEELAMEADEKARKKEYRAEATGSFLDGIKARKARAEAEDLAREAEEVLAKERRKREREKSYLHASGSTKREVVIVPVR